MTRDVRDLMIHFHKRSISDGEHKGKTFGYLFGHVLHYEDNTSSCIVKSGLKGHKIKNYRVFTSKDSWAIEKVRIVIGEEVSGRYVEYEYTKCPRGCLSSMLITLKDSKALWHSKFKKDKRFREWEVYYYSSYTQACNKKVVTPSLSKEDFLASLDRCDMKIYLRYGLL